MAEQISDADFTPYETSDFATGAALVAAIAVEADEVGHAPLIDPEGNVVDLATWQGRHRS